MVFSAPQLSLIEMQQVAALLSAKRIHDETTLIVCTSPEIKSGADRMGLTRRMEEAGAASSSPASASTKAMRVRWPRRTAGSV